VGVLISGRVLERGNNAVGTKGLSRARTASYCHSSYPFSPSLLPSLPPSLPPSLLPSFPCTAVPGLREPGGEIGGMQPDGVRVVWAKLVLAVRETSRQWHLPGPFPGRDHGEEGGREGEREEGRKSSSGSNKLLANMA
jgi:hypothetical protein